MAQSLPEIGRLLNLGVKMDKNVYKNREPPYQIGRIGISVVCGGVLPPNFRGTQRVTLCAKRKGLFT